MADKKVFEIEAKGGAELKKLDETVNGLRKSIKAAKDEQVAAAAKFGEGSKEFVQASKNVAALRDKMEDLNDSSRSLAGSGIERSAQGFSQLGEGLRNLDFDKVKVGLTAIKSALAATGVMLLVQGVTYLIENFKELSEGSGIVAKALQFVGGILSELKKGLDFVTDSLGLTNSKLEKQGELIVTSAEKTKEALAGQTAEYDRLIAQAKANGKSTVELEIQKQEAIIRTNKQILEQALAYVRAGGVLSEEQTKLVNQAIEDNKNAISQIKVIKDTAAKEEKDKATENYKEALKDKKAHEKEMLDEEKKRIKDMDDFRRKIEKEWEDSQKQSRKEFKDSAYAEDDELFNAFNTNVEKKKKAKELEKEQDKAAFNDTLATSKATLDSQQVMFDVYYGIRQSKLKKGSAEELKLAKQQFNINKALSLQSTIISGIQGVVNALSAQSVIPEPYGTILKVANAVAVGIAATANTIKIASTKFQVPSGEGDSGGSGPVAPALPAPPGGGVPKIDNPTNTPGTKLNEDGTKAQPPVFVVKAQVVETESTATQKDVAKMEAQATFP